VPEIKARVRQHPRRLFVSVTRGPRPDYCFPSLIVRLAETASSRDNSAFHESGIHCCRNQNWRPAFRYTATANQECIGSNEAESICKVLCLDVVIDAAVQEISGEGESSFCRPLIRRCLGCLEGTCLDFLVRLSDICYELPVR
jgi:hypothetical protein